MTYFSVCFDENQCDELGNIPVLLIVDAAHRAGVDPLDVYLGIE